MVAERNKYLYFFLLWITYRQIDLWKQQREKEFGSEIEEERIQNEITKKEMKVKELSKKKYAIQKLLCSIDLLYSKRLANLEKQGYRSSHPTSAIEKGLLQTAAKEIAEYKEVIISEKKKKNFVYYLL